MKNTYTVVTTAICPKDNKTVDTYSVKVQVRRTLMVEEILEAIAYIKSLGPIYQENFTAQLSIRLQAKVTTVGVHSCVETKVVCKA